MTIAPVLREGLLAQPRLDQESTSFLQLLPFVTWDDSTISVAEVPIESIVVRPNGNSESLASPDGDTVTPSAPRDPAGQSGLAPSERGGVGAPLSQERRSDGSPSGIAAALADLGNLDGLTASIQTRGVLEPLIVTPNRRLLAGRRRLEAARRAGLTKVPVRVCEIANERTAIEIGLVENVERADLDPLTRATSYQALIELGAAVEEIGRLVGQGIGHVYQHLALLDLHPDVQGALHAHALSFADARSLTPLPLDDQATVLKEIRQSPKPLSSRQVKAHVDARRVMRLVQQPPPELPRTHGEEENVLEGNYGALFDVDDSRNANHSDQVAEDPLHDLNVIIGEMVAAAQGEDQMRAWARRLSRALQLLGDRQRIREGNSRSISPRNTQYDLGL